MRYLKKTMLWSVTVSLVAGMWLGFTSTAAAQTEANPKKWLEKKIAFEKRGEPWPRVFEYLSELTGLPMITGNVDVRGTFTFINPAPKGMEKYKYSVLDIIDIINAGLLTNPETNKFVLIRKNRYFTLIPASEKVDRSLIPRITEDQLKYHGKTEIVEVVKQFKVLIAEEIQSEVKRMMGPFGDIVALSAANQLLMIDTVENLQRITKTLNDIEENVDNLSQAYSHECKYIRASVAGQKLQEFLGKSEERVQFLDKEGQRQTTLTKVRTHNITWDDRSQTVHVNASPDKIAKAKYFLSQIDKGDQQIIRGEPFLAQYSVESGNAEKLAEILKEVLEDAQNLRIQANGSDLLIVYAYPEDHFTITKHIEKTKRPSAKAKLIRLQYLDAKKTEETLIAMYGADNKGAPFVAAQPLQNALFVKGTQSQVEEVQSIINALGEDPAMQKGDSRTVVLEQGSAATLARALQRLVPQMRSNPVQVILPGDVERPKIKKELPKIEPPDLKKATPKLPPINYAKPKLNQISHQELVDPQEKKTEPKKKPGDEKKPITIMAFGNKLIINSEDEKALRLVNDLIRLLTQTQAGEGDFQVIPIRYASAVDVAKVLDEFFNGPKQNNARGGRDSGRGGRPGGGGGGFNPLSMMQNALGMGGDSGGVGGRTERIRVVADPATNSLLVKATPIDFLTIDNLLKTTLDVDRSKLDSDALVRTHVIGPLKYANATDVAEVVKDVYKPLMETSGRSRGSDNDRGRGGFPFFMRGGGDRSDNKSNSGGGGPQLSVGVDDRTNSLVIATTTSIHDDITKLVEQLEKAASNTTEVVEFVPVQGDPNVVKEVFDALQGIKTSTPTSGAGGFRGFSGGRFSGFGGDGGRPSFGGRGRSTGRRPQTRGPDFFGQRVKEDPESSVLYDPAQKRPQTTPSKNGTPPAILPVGQINRSTKVPAPRPTPAAAQPQSPRRLPQIPKGPIKKGPQGQENGKTDPGISQAPRRPVDAVPLPTLQGVLLRVQSKKDLELALKIIEVLAQNAKDAEINVRIVPLQFGDVNVVTDKLNQLYSRVMITTSTISGAGVTAPGVGPGQLGGAQAQAEGVVFLPLPRFNSILVAAPKIRMANVISDIEALDRPLSNRVQARPFHLKRASAARVASLLSSFYSTRFPGETQNLVRLTYDDGSNTVFVQAAPADMEEIGRLIAHIDNIGSKAVNNVQIVRLNYALANDLTLILTQAINQGVTASSTFGAGGVVPQVGGIGGQGQIGGGIGGQQGQIGGIGGQIGGLGGQRQIGGQQIAAGGNLIRTKATTLRFLGEKGELQASILDDIVIVPDVRLNALIIAAPEKTMDLILALVRQLDTPPQARAEINIFTLKNSDAQQVLQLLQQLFQGTGAQQQPGGAAVPGQIGGGVGVGGAGTQQRPPLQITLPGQSPAGAPIIDLRVTVDPLTNSLIVAGSRSDLDIIEAIIARLEGSDVQRRRNETYQLQNALAADVATALNDFLTQSVTVIDQGGLLTAFQTILRNVIVVPEPITNTLLISATPEYYEDVMRIIRDIDSMPPQVVIQVLIADVELNNLQEFGVEMGFQSPVLFRRGVFGDATTSLADPFTNPGVTVNTTTSTAVPGFNFNNVLAPLGNNVVSPGVVGYQGLVGNLGVGRVSPTANIGGFVFSAASESVNILVRALRTQGRLQILSRPQIMALDNQTARINVGQNVPLNGGSFLAQNGIVQTNVIREDVGVILTVTPKIYPDGRVLLRVIPEVSSLDEQPVNLGGGQFGTAINIQRLETTVTAYDGETIALGGLITRNDSKLENKIPLLGDVPVLGALFRYRTHTKSKRELLIIMTPHVVRSRAEAERVLGEEAQRMDWSLGEVLKIHGPQGLHMLFPHQEPPLGGNAPFTAPHHMQATPDSPLLYPGMSPEQMPFPRESPPASQPQYMPNETPIQQAPISHNEQFVPNGPMIQPAPR